MPEFTPSGIKDQWKKMAELKSAKKYAKKLDEQAAAAKALADWLKDFPPQWKDREIPAPEGYFAALIWQECAAYPEAIAQARRFLEVAPPDNVNYANCTTLLITCLALSGDYDGAEEEIKKAVETAFKDRESDRRVTEETLALAQMRGGRLEDAARHFEYMATASYGDVEAAIHGVDCWLRVGKLDEAVRLAQRAADTIKEGRHGERAKSLLQQVGLVGKPAPSFAAAKWWKGSGGPVTDEMLKGHVTVVFVWNMKSQLMSWMFERLNKVVEETADKGVQFVGISRLARFDPLKMATMKQGTDEDELQFYDMWATQYKVTYPLAVGGYEDDALINAWAAHNVPYFVVVGKDGKVFYMRSGKEEEHMMALRDMILKAANQ
jgi:tetratricopeptide (TPR) repeat protein